MTFWKKIRLGTLTLAISLAISISFMTVMTGCGKDEASTTNSAKNGEKQSGQSISEEVSNPEQPADQGESLKPNANEKLPEFEISANELQSLEKVSAKDGEKFLAALKQQDAKALSSLMAYAENEYTEADMAKVLGGFLLYFDNLEELNLHFEANEQNEEYYVEHYTIRGTKDGNKRAIPFQVKYTKSQGIETIQDDNMRLVLYDSRLIGQYPYADLVVERYVQYRRVTMSRRINSGSRFMMGASRSTIFG